MNKKKLIILLAAAALVAIGAVIYFTQGSEEGASSGDSARIEKRAALDKEEKIEKKILKKTDTERAGKYSEELFRISLKYLREKGIDRKDFRIKSALIVQDLESDLIFFSFTAGKDTHYACYSYDEHAFSQDSDKAIKNEYDDMLLVMEYDDEEYNVYYRYSDKEISEANGLF